MRLQFQTVDVFTSDRFAGNPLAVVLNAEGLSAPQMQAIAAEFNLAETTFVLPPNDTTHTAEVRSRIGYVSQLGGADNLCTGRENLVLQGRLYGGELTAGPRPGGGWRVSAVLPLSWVSAPVVGLRANTATALLFCDAI